MNANKRKFAVFHRLRPVVGCTIVQRTKQFRKPESIGDLKPFAFIRVHLRTEKSLR
jgi:hypothetical protein